MNKSRRIGAIVAMATAAVGMATATTAAPAAAAPRGPEPVSNWLRAVQAHQDTWVNIYWRTNVRICDAEVRVYARDVEVDYRGFRRSATFSRGDSLRPGRTDFTPIRVDADFNRAGVARLRAVISYDGCGWKARTQTRSFSLGLPVLRNSHPGQNWPGRPGHDGRPGHGGWPGHDGRPGNHGRPGHDGRPGRPNWPGRPTPTATATTTPTTAPTTTVPVPTTTTTAPTTAPTTTPAGGQGGQGGQWGNGGNRGHGHGHGNR